VETRHLVAQFETPQALRDALMRFIAENSVQACVLYRELDFFEQLGALERHGGIDFELIRSLLGRHRDRSRTPLTLAGPGVTRSRWW
jgi:hypothetical protein